MATSGTITGSYGSGTSGLKLRASWSRTSSGIDATGPYSVITVTIEYTRTSTGYTTYKLNAPYSLEIDGAVVDSGNHTYDVRSVTANTYVTYISKTNITVRHDANGAKTAMLKFTVNLSGTSAKSGAISGNIVLDSIAMGSTIKLNASSYKISNATGPTATVTITRYSTSYYHKIIWKVGSTTVYSKNVGQVASTTQALAAADWLTKMTNASSSTATATLYTYSDSGYTKQVGTASEVSFTVICGISPTASGSYAIDTNCVAYKAGITTGYISGGFSKTVVTVTGSGVHGSTITKYDFYQNDTLKQSGTTNAFTSDAFVNDTEIIKCIVTDSRGLTTTYRLTFSKTATTSSLKINEYTPPVLNVKKIYRTANSTSTAQSDSGTYLYVLADFTISNTSIGNGAAGFGVSYKKSTDSSYTSVTLTKNTASHISGFAADSSYDVYIAVIDKLGKYTNYVTTIPTESVTLDFPVGGKGLGIGMVATQGSNRIDTPWQYKSTKASGFGFENEGSGGYLGLRLKNSSTNKIIQFEIGNDGKARGIYDPGAGSWSYCVNADDNVFINRLRHITSAPIGSGNSCQVVFLSDPPKSVVDADATAYSDDYWKSYLKWVCETYPDQTNTLFIGRLSPSSRCIVILFIYSTAAAYVDDTTGLPQYSFGIYIPYQGTTAKDALYKFGTSAYTFYRYNPFGSAPTYSTTSTITDIFSSANIGGEYASVNNIYRHVYGRNAQICGSFTALKAIPNGTNFAIALFKENGAGAYEPIASPTTGGGRDVDIWSTNAIVRWYAAKDIAKDATMRWSFSYITHG